MKRISWILLGMGMFFLNACTLFSGLQIVNHPAPEISVDLTPFTELGCQGTYWSCAKEPPLSDFGCSVMMAPDPMLGALNPNSPLGLCKYYGENPVGGVYRGGCARPEYVHYVLYQDGAYSMLSTPEEFRSFFAPIETENEALSYAMAMTGYSASFGQQKLADAKYEVKTIEDTHVVKKMDGYEINLFHFQFCGCGPHTMTEIRLLITPDGQINELGKQVMYEDLKMKDMCVD